ncbi:hypothetical protein LPY66_07980 [Dehalobacter sp. DCM]|uniref:hypothetical protein n=1 Tax=Dehalobacter sp. DCM TaxID=2907827 RepID=UPI0030821C96|nr:hypothetical protein LPY66_07980 [Dehalobacter sp. DCM]
MNPLQIKEKDPLYQFKHWGLMSWNGIIFMAVFMIFWGMCHNIPPMNPAFTPAEVAQIFRDDHNIFRLGMVVCMTFAVCYGIWGVYIGKVMEKVVGKNSILIPIEIMGAELTVVAVLVSCSFWLTAGYRPDLPDTQLQQLLDNAWMLMDTAYFVTSVQMFALGAAFLSDWREKPLVPKWVSWYGIFVGFAFIAECWMPFFYEGMFARNGYLNFWFEFPIWFIWCPLLSAFLIKALPRLKKEALEEVKQAN